MNYQKITGFIILISIAISANAQIVFQEDFNTDNYLSIWSLTSKVEKAVWLGNENSNYIRFHPNFQNQNIISPALNLATANYILYFEWNKVSTLAVDSINVQMTKDNGNSWQTVYAIYNGNNRIWQTDSIFLNNIGGFIKFRWNYFSSGSYPSQYFNIDNITLKKNTATGIKTNANELNVEVFPNPSNGNFQLKLVNTKNRTGKILIYSIAGELVYQNNLPNISQSLLQINLSDLSKGAYLLKIQLEELFYSKTILIQ